MLVRTADPDRDAAPVAAIYAETGIATVASFEERAPSPEEMAGRMRTILGRYPWLVAESDGAVAGYAYATEHRWRSAYRWAADVTVYIAPGHHRRGAGRALYTELLARLTAQGLHSALAGITLPNPASVGLHEAFGFRRIGVYQNIGYKHGAWRSVAWYQAQLRAPEPDGTAPAEPRPPQP
ncbi:MAG TPA: arsinothricin resistance N-acetyltransferase ArsN1 family B [Solirubrobacteraceae bacterium]|nr:arsinothricin resistance N-acetyltransferase ArsN1 family B [Solirubrobacteraceae bacterium]